jgi:hypothetical protein
MADRPVVVDSSISLSKAPSIDIAPVSIQDPKDGKTLASTTSKNPKEGVPVDTGSPVANPKDGIDLETKALKDPKAGVTIQAISSSELRLGVGINPDLPKGTVKTGSLISATEDPRSYAKA